MAKIEIIIRNKRKRPAPNRTVRGPIIPRDEPEYLPRRRTGFTTFNFIDRGLLNDGSDIDFYYQPSISLSKTRNPGGLNFNEIVRATIGRFRSTQWTDWFGYLFSEPVANWKSLYHTLPYASYGLYSEFVSINSRGYVETTPPSIDTSADKLVWTTSGLQAKERVTRLSLRSDQKAYHYFDTGDTTKYKITPDHNYSSAAVTINFGKTCNVYLIPRLSMMIGTSLSKSGYPPADTWKTAFLNGVFIPYPRAIFPQYRDHTLSNFPSSDPTGYFADYLDWLKSRPYSRITEYVRTTDYSGLHSTTDVSNGSGSVFPYADQYQLVFMNEIYDGSTTTFDLGADGLAYKSIVDDDLFVTADIGFFEIPSDPMVVGVIETNGQFYYVWTTDAFYNFQQIDHEPRKAYEGFNEFAIPSDSPFNVQYNGGW
jgi:hypothetical protein